MSRIKYGDWEAERLAEVMASAEIESTKKKYLDQAKKAIQELKIGLEKYDQELMIKEDILSAAKNSGIPDSWLEEVEFDISTESEVIEHFLDEVDGGDVIEHAKGTPLVSRWGYLQYDLDEKGWAIGSIYKRHLWIYKDVLGIHPRIDEIYEVLKERAKNHDDIEIEELFLKPDEMRDELEIFMQRPKDRGASYG